MSPHTHTSRPWPRVPAFLLAGLLAVSAALGAQATDSAALAALARNPTASLPFDPNARVGTLSNGLRYYIRTNSRPEKRAEIRLVVNAGSVVEDPDQLGLAHVVEHMAFNGTRRFAKQQIVDFIERAGMTFGADLNAGTGFDETVYQLQVPSDTGNYVSRALDWIADVAGGAITFDSLELERERPVVMEEWRLGRGANERLQQQHLPFLFRGSRYADRLPIGTQESLARFTRSQAMRFYRDWYRPDLMAVIVVGDIDVNRIESELRAKFGQIPAASPGARSRDVTTVPLHAETLIKVAADSEAAEANVGLLWKQPVRRRSTVADYRTDITAALLLSSLNARFRETARAPRAPFVDAGAAHGRLVRAIESFSLSAMVDDTSLVRGFNALLSEAERVRRFGFTDAEIARQKAEILRSVETQLAERDRTESAVFAARYADHFLTADVLLGIELRAPLVRELMSLITVDDVNRLARAWLADSSRVVLASLPLKAGRAIPPEDSLRVLLERAPTLAVTPYVEGNAATAIVPNPPRGGRIVNERPLAGLDATEWILSNGIRVIVKQTDFQQDEVLVAGVSVGGVGGVTPAQYYSARLAPLMLERGGVGSIDAAALTRMLAGKRAGVSADLGDRDESVSGQTAPSDLQTFFEVMWARLMLPRIDSTAVEALKQQYLGMLGNRSNDPMAAYVDTIGAVMSQGHPMAKPVTDSIVRTLDVRVGAGIFRERFADFSDFTFIIVGAVNPAAVRPFVERWIASLPSAGRRDSARSAGITPPPGHVARVVRKGSDPRARSTMILTGDIEWTPQSSMYAAALSDILNIRMRETLREDLGGTYSAGVSTSVDRWPVGRFSTSITFGAAPERVDSLSDVALGVLRGFVARGPTNDELAKVRENMLRGRETALRQNDFWMDLFQQQALWGDDPAANVRGFEGRVRALDARSLQQFAARVLNETNLARFTLLPERSGTSR